jgi:hypothetical protein
LLHSSIQASSLHHMQVCLAMSDFRENVEKHEAVNVPEDPDALPEEWAKQQVGLFVLLLQWQRIHAADVPELVCCAVCCAFCGAVCCPQWTLQSNAQGSRCAGAMLAVAASTWIHSRLIQPSDAPGPGSHGMRAGALRCLGNGSEQMQQTCHSLHELCISHESNVDVGGRAF